jgi:ferredoxin
MTKTRKAMIMIKLIMVTVSLSTCCGFQVWSTCRHSSNQRYYHRHPSPSTNCMARPLASTSSVCYIMHHQTHLSNSNDSENDSNNAPLEGDTSDNGGGRIDVSIDPRLYRIRLSRAPGIEWGTDLSFSFVYVRDMDPTGQASMSGQVDKGDQLCEIIPIPSSSTTTMTTTPALNLLGASFDFVMTTFASLDKTVSELDFVFFRGTKQELKDLCRGEAAKSESDLITVTVIENKGSAQERLTRLQAPAGTNVRQLLVDNGINVYQSITRWTNCQGKQLCGTCIVNIADGLPNTNWKSMDEASTLRSNPDSYRLSCVTFAHGDVTVETFPPINADQWTR